MESLFLVDVHAITDRICERYMGKEGAAGLKPYPRLLVEAPSADTRLTTLNQLPALWQMVGDKTQELKLSHL